MFSHNDANGAESNMKLYFFEFAMWQQQSAAAQPAGQMMMLCDVLSSLPNGSGGDEVCYYCFVFF